MNPQSRPPSFGVVGPDPEELREEEDILRAAESPQTDAQLDSIAASLAEGEEDWGKLPPQPDPSYRVGWIGSIPGVEPPAVDERLGAPNLFVGIGPAGVIRAAEANAAHSIPATGRVAIITACTRIGLRVALDPSGANPSWIVMPMIGGAIWPGTVANLDGTPRAIHVAPDWLAKEAPNLARCGIQEEAIETQGTLAVMVRGGTVDYASPVVDASRPYLDAIILALVHGLGLDGVLATISLGARDDGSPVVTDFVPWWTADAVAQVRHSCPGMSPWDIAAKFFRMIDIYTQLFTPPADDPEVANQP